MSKRHGLVFMVGMITAVIVFIVSVGQGIAQPAKAKDEAPVKIGFITNLSKPWGKTNKIAMEISLEELNKAGGILGQPVELLVEDYKGDLSAGVAAYKKLVASEKCNVVFIESTDNILASMDLGARLYKEYPHIVFFTWAAGAEITTRIAKNYDKFKHIFSLFGNTSMFLEPEFKFESAIAKAAPSKKIALMIEDSTFGKELQYGLPDRKKPSYIDVLKKKGYTFTHIGNNAIGEKMFLPMFEQIAASKPEAIFWITATCDTVTIAKQWADSAAKNIPLVMGAGAVSMASFYKMTGGAALGISAMCPEADVPYTKKTIPFLRELAKRGVGQQMSMWGAYDVAWIYKAAVEKTKSTKNVDAIIKALESNEVQEVCWKWKFDPKYHEPKIGWPYFEYAHGQFQKDGKYVVVGTEAIRKLIADPKQDYKPLSMLR